MSCPRMCQIVLSVSGFGAIFSRSTFVSEPVHNLVHREVLAWKYLASTCRTEKGQVQCPLKQRAQFGTMNPRQHSSAPASMEFMGREKVTVGNVEKELSKLELKSETGSWLIWFDDQFKVLRISIPSEKTEVVRD